MAKIGSAVFQTSWHKPKASSQASRPSPKGPPIKRRLNRSEHQFPFAFQSIASRVGRNQYAFSFCYSHHAITPAENSLSLQHQQRMKGRVIRRKFLFSRQADLCYSKLLAAGKKRPHAAWKPLRLSLRLRLPVRRRQAGHHLSLFHMKLAGLSVGSYSAVIIDPVGGVGVLLNLRNQNSFANGVQSSRGNENTSPL